MLPLLHSCECFPSLHPSLCLKSPFFPSSVILARAFLYSPKYSAAKPPDFSSKYCKNVAFNSNFQKLGRTHLRFCVRNEVIEDFELPEKPKSEELELLNKPSPRPINDNGSVGEIVDDKLNSSDKDDILEDFYKLFKPRDSLQGKTDVEESRNEEENMTFSVEYYEPNPGDFIVGVVVSGNENKLDVNVGADMLGTMLTKEMLPLYDKEMNLLLCDLEKDSEEFMAKGKMGVLKNDEAMSADSIAGRPVVEPGTVLFAEVLGRTLSGRPLLSTRRLIKRVAWHRVRQIKQLNEPIVVKITEWNTGGLLTRIEGLRAFIPKIELMNRITNYTDLKENVGRWLHVLITRINEDTNDLILSEKEAWEMLNLVPGTLLDGTVKKIFPFGAQIRIGDSNRSGLLHISNISRERIPSVDDILAVDEKVKVLVIKSMFPDKISLSIAELESEPGLFLSSKEKVYAEAETMARKYKQNMSDVSVTKKIEPLPSKALYFQDEENFFANWKWFEFERDDEPNSGLSEFRPFFLEP